MQLVVFAGENSWPAVQGITHWNRGASPLSKLYLHFAAESPASTATARGLERWMRDAVPACDVVLHEGADHPESVRRFLAGLPATPAVDAEPTPGSYDRVIDATGLGPGAMLGLEPVLADDGICVLRREPGGTWIRVHRNREGCLDLSVFGGMRREVTDDLSVASLVRAHFGRGDSKYRFASTAVEAHPTAALTQAALEHGWRWPDAFAALGIGGGERPEEHFARYVGAVLRSLGIANVVVGTIEKGPDGAAAGSCAAAVWANHLGRITLLDLGGGGLTETVPGGDRPLAGEILAAAARFRLLGTLGIQASLIRPAQRISEVERALAAAHGVRLLDEQDCHDLPECLAQLFGIPMNADTTEALRLLRVHLAESGRTRVFSEETWVVREQLAGGGDPVIADVDTWLQRIQVVRGQNWMAWTHRSRIWIRVPAEKGRPETVEDWRLVLAMVLGQVPEHIHAVLRDNSVWLDLAEQTEVKRRASEWFRPFLNAPISFAAAQTRFAAEARINTEAAPQKPVRTSPSGLPARATEPPRRASGPTAARGGAPGAGRGGGLDDLDRALDGLGA